MTIGERIKARRLELGLSQEDVALKCDYKSRSSINKIELSRDLPLRKVELMAKALNCTPAYLMGWEDSEGKEVIEPEPEIDIKTKEALELYEKYLNAIPEIQSAVENLLKGSRHDS